MNRILKKVKVIHHHGNAIMLILITPNMSTIKKTQMKIIFKLITMRKVFIRKFQIVSFKTNHIHFALILINANRVIIKIIYLPIMNNKLVHILIFMAIIIKLVIMNIEICTGKSIMEYTWRIIGEKSILMKLRAQAISIWVKKFLAVLVMTIIRIIQM